MFWQRVYEDFVGLFMNKMFMIFVNSYLEWFEVQVMLNVISEIIIEKFCDIFDLFGILECLVSNNGL